MRILPFILSTLAIITSAPGAKLELIAGGGDKPADAQATECKLREPFAVEFMPCASSFPASKKSVCDHECD